MQTAARIFIALVSILTARMVLRGDGFSLEHTDRAMIGVGFIILAFVSLMSIGEDKRRSTFWQHPGPRAKDEDDGR